MSPRRRPTRCSGATPASVTRDWFSSAGVRQRLPWGNGTWSVSWDAARTTSNSPLNSFDPACSPGSKSHSPSRWCATARWTCAAAVTHREAQRSQLGAAVPRERSSAPSRPVKQAYWTLKALARQRHRPGAIAGRWPSSSPGRTASACGSARRRRLISCKWRRKSPTVAELSFAQKRPLPTPRICCVDSSWIRRTRRSGTCTSRRSRIRSARSAAGCRGDRRTGDERSLRRLARDQRREQCRGQRDVPVQPATAGRAPRDVLSRQRSRRNAAVAHRGVPRHHHRPCRQRVRRRAGTSPHQRLPDLERRRHRELPARPQLRGGERRYGQASNVSRPRSVSPA